MPGKSVLRAVNGWPVVRPMSRDGASLMACVLLSHVLSEFVIEEIETTL
jgi:hypothetical protein